MLLTISDVQLIPASHLVCVAAAVGPVAIVLHLALCYSLHNSCTGRLELPNRRPTAAAAAAHVIIRTAAAAADIIPCTAAGIGDAVDRVACEAQA